MRLSVTTTCAAFCLALCMQYAHEFASGGLDIRFALDPEIILDDSLQRMEGIFPDMYQRHQARLAKLAKMAALAEGERFAHLHKNRAIHTKCHRKLLTRLPSPSSFALARAMTMTRSRHRVPN